jgi:hypothetical protein
MDLPSIEECVAFKAAIDTGRGHAGLPPIRYLDFDGAEPGNPRNCLSARNLFREAGYGVGGEDLLTLARADPGSLGILPERLPRPGGYSRRAIPAVILAVTGPFDACEWQDGDPRPHLDTLRALRARLVEAGVVAP